MIRLLIVASACVAALVWAILEMFGSLGWNE
jgi:hypothetical protein